MSSSSSRDRAEAALGHLQQAAGEMIAAARDALELVEDAVSAADADDILDAVDFLSRSVFTWARTQDRRPPPASPPDDPVPDPRPGPRPGRRPGPRPGPEDSAPDPGSQPGSDRGSQQGTRPQSSGPGPGSDRASEGASKPGRARRPPPGDGPVERIPVR